MAWDRCPRSWWLRSRKGIRGPVSPPQIMGSLVEEALVGLFMERPGPPGEGRPAEASAWVGWSRRVHGGLARLESSSIEMVDGEVIDAVPALRAWLEAKVPAAAAEVHRRGALEWAATAARAAATDWSDVDIERTERMLRGGLALAIEEIEACLADVGGPLLAHARVHGDPYAVPTPVWHEAPVAPPGSAVASEVMGEATDARAGWPWQKGGAPCSVLEAWELARPWGRDPRIGWNQRLYHVAGWASGELDLCVRWRGEATIIDVKASDSTSIHSKELARQLLFYGWLWRAAVDAGTPVALHRGRQRTPERVTLRPLGGLEGWYLDGPLRTPVDPVALDDGSWGDQVAGLWQQMQAAVSDALPLAEPAPWLVCEPGGREPGGGSGEPFCGRCDVRAFCTARPDEERVAALAAMLPERYRGADLAAMSAAVAPRPPAQALSTIPRRVHVRGRLAARWGPFPNALGEPVHGAVLVAGGATQLQVEEVVQGAAPALAEPGEVEVALIDAMPGAWRGQPRLSLDERSQVRVLLEGDDADALLPPDAVWTPLGLLRTRATVDGLVIGRSESTGMAASGRPWSLVGLTLWDGEETIELVAFGNSRNATIDAIGTGDRLLVHGASLGWWSGEPQLRLDPGRTRVDIEPAEPDAD